MVTDFSLNLALLPPLDQSKCIFPPLHFSFVTYKMWDNNPYVINNNDNYMRKCIQLKSKNKYYFLIDISTKWRSEKHLLNLLHLTVILWL